MDDARSFKIGGKTVSLTRGLIEAAVHNVVPGPINKYSVLIRDVRYPIKQVVSLAAGQPPAAFIATDAYRILNRLGFTVESETSETTYCENVVCDVHQADMRFVQVRHGMGLVTKALDGFACKVKGCQRFFGTEGYCDLTEKSAFTNVRSGPRCSRMHEEQSMYIQRKSEGFQWVCPACDSVAEFCT